jgi:TRAP transporter TAXI family solute receptor
LELKSYYDSVGNILKKEERKMKRKGSQMLVLGMLLFGGLLATYERIPASTPTNLPPVIVITSYNIGTGNYIVCSGIREVIEKFTPMKARVEPYGTEVERVMPLLRKEAHISMLSEASAVMLSKGLFDYAIPKWGPQKLRLLHRGCDLDGGQPVRASSSIMTLADLKGKRVPFVPGNMAVNKCQEGCLAFGGLTWKDVVKVNVSGYGIACKGVLEGSWDVVWMSPAAPAARELASSQFGCRYLPMPSEDREGWKRLQAVSPWLKPALITAGATMSKEKPFPLAIYSYSLCVYDFLDESVAYEVSKAIHKGYDTIKGMHPWLAGFSIDNALDLAKLGETPYHPGCIKYFKEIGRWTPDHEKWQAEQLKKEKERLNTWKSDPKAWEKKYKE